jgi:hypothetical protein
MDCKKDETEKVGDEIGREERRGKEVGDETRRRFLWSARLAGGWPAGCVTPDARFSSIRFSSVQVGSEIIKFYFHHAEAIYRPSILLPSLPFKLYSYGANKFNWVNKRPCYCSNIRSHLLPIIGTAKAEMADLYCRKGHVRPCFNAPRVYIYHICKG